MQERTVGGVPPALDGLRTIDLGEGIADAEVTYRVREATWVGLADEGFDRLARVEAKCAGLVERVGLLEAQIACAGGFIATTLDHCTSLLSQAERAIREGGGR
jgi:hypothetical protein